MRLLLAFCVVLGLAGNSARAMGVLRFPVSSRSRRLWAVWTWSPKTAQASPGSRVMAGSATATRWRSRISLRTHARSSRNRISMQLQIWLPAHAGSAVQLALAGRRALWSSVDVGNSQYMTLWSGSSQQRTGRAILASTWNGTVTGGQLRGIAGNADTLVYAVSNWKAIADCPAAQLGTPCNAGGATFSYPSRRSAGRNT